MTKKKEKHTGHYCKVCHQYKANEKFSGKGHAKHICKACSRLSASQRKELDNESMDSVEIVYCDEEIEELQLHCADIDLMPFPTDSDDELWEKLSAFIEDELMDTMVTTREPLKGRKRQKEYRNIIKRFSTLYDIKLKQDDELRDFFQEILNYVTAKLKKRGRFDKQG